MDPVSEWVTSLKIPIGRWGRDFFTFLTTNFEWFFDSIADGFAFVLEGLIGLLLMVPPLIVVLAVAALAWWLQRSWKLAIGCILGLFFIINQGLWDETMETVVLVVAAAATSMALGVPIGIWAAHNPKGYAWLQPVLDLMQTLPTFVYLIPAIVFFGIGMVPGLLATVIFVLPAPLRLTQLGIASTPPTLIEAATAFGATPRQLLWKVELPSALPQIMAGLNQTIMLSLSMVVIAALVGASGLGVPVVRALNSVNTALGFEAGFVIVVVAILLDRILRMEGPR